MGEPIGRLADGCLLGRARVGVCQCVSDALVDWLVAFFPSYLARTLRWLFD